MHEPKLYMEDLIIQATRMTPAVEFKTTGTLSVWGPIFLSENPKELMDSLHSWIDDYIRNPSFETKFNIGLGYAPRNCWYRFMDIAWKLSTIQDQQHFVLIAWHFEDFDDDFKDWLQFELGKLNVPHVVIPVLDIE
jgi:SiaC family regulatory phosphoprotein